MTQASKLIVTEVNDLTITRAVLDHLGVGPGDSVIVELLPGGRAQVRADRPASIEAFFGSLPHDGPTVSLQAMDDAIRAGAARRP